MPPQHRWSRAATVIRKDFTSLYYMDCILQKGTKSIAMLLRLRNFILCNKATVIMQKDEIYKIIFVLNLQFLGCKDIKCLDDQVFFCKTKEVAQP